MSNLIQGTGKVLATMFIWIMVLYVFIPNANFKLITVLLNNIGISYYDAVSPLFVLVLLAASYFWIVEGRNR